METTYCERFFSAYVQKFSICLHLQLGKKFVFVLYSQGNTIYRGKFPVKAPKNMISKSEQRDWQNSQQKFD